MLFALFEKHPRVLVFLFDQNEHVRFLRVRIFDFFYYRVVVADNVYKSLIFVTVVVAVVCCSRVDA